MRLVLASASPRRAELLRAAGIPFHAVPVDVDERLLAGERVQDAVQRLAEAKASSAARSDPDTVVLGADTLVVLEGKTLGKPADASDATRMLRLLSGRTHQVLTGVCLRHHDAQLLHLETTHVRMATLTSEEIEWYVSTGEPLDKAGAYGVQGLASRFVEAVDGSYSNVVGLPVSSVWRLLRQLGCDILVDTKTS